jgi:hypothetical protein
MFNENEDVVRKLRSTMVMTLCDEVGGSTSAWVLSLSWCSEKSLKREEGG